MEQVLTETFWLDVISFLVIVFYILLNLYITYKLISRHSNNKIKFYTICIALILLAPFLIYIAFPFINSYISPTAITVAQIIVNFFFLIIMKNRIEKRNNKDILIKDIFESRFELMSLIEERLKREKKIESRKEITLDNDAIPIDLAYLYVTLSDGGITKYYTKGIE